MRTRSFLLGCTVYAAGFVAAVTPSNSVAQTRVRDSVGIRIVESSAPTWTAAERWTISHEPRLEIGMVDGPDAYILFLVRGAFRFSDGRIAVNNGSTREIRLYDADGHYLNALGGEGEGPGEFRELEIWKGTADTLFAFDPTLGRVTVFDASGALVRVVPVREPAGRGKPTAFGTDETGSFWVTSGTGSVNPFEESGLIEGGTVFLSRYSPTGRFQNEIARLRLPNHFIYRGGGRSTLTTVPLVVDWPPFAWDSDRLYAGQGDIAEIQVRMGTGTLERIVRWSATPAPVTEQVLTGLRRQTLPQQGSEDDRRYWERWLREVPIPEVLPIYQRLKVDASGNLWVEHYRPPWDPSPVWSVFDAKGVWLGDLMTPPRMVITDIGADYVLGVYRDEWDVMKIRLYALVRPSSDTG